MMRTFIIVCLIAVVGLSACSSSKPVSETQKTKVTAKKNAPKTLSDEQSFDAVSARETAESDAARKAENSARYEIITVDRVPEASGKPRVSIIEFAITTRHSVGLAMYKRGKSGYRDYQENCAGYLNADAAQEAFLTEGEGPEKDRLRLDPDGDGFACGWDPAFYRIR